MDRNTPITSKHVFAKRSAKINDGTEKPKLPSQFQAAQRDTTNFPIKEKFLVIQNYIWAFKMMYLLSFFN